jgi:hypothetical protein
MGGYLQPNTKTQQDLLCVKAVLLFEQVVQGDRPESKGAGWVLGSMESCRFWIKPLQGGFLLTLRMTYRCG